MVIFAVKEITGLDEVHETKHDREMKVGNQRADYPYANPEQQMVV